MNLCLEPWHACRAIGGERQHEAVESLGDVGGAHDDDEADARMLRQRTARKKAKERDARRDAGPCADKEQWSACNDLVSEVLDVRWHGHGTSECHARQVDVAAAAEAQSKPRELERPTAFRCDVNEEGPRASRSCRHRRIESH